MNESRMAGSSRLNETNMGEVIEVLSPRNKMGKKHGSVVSPQERNKMRGVSFEGITREYRDKVMVSYLVSE